jgi:hypothetical protein
MNQILRRALILGIILTYIKTGFGQQSAEAGLSSIKRGFIDPPNTAKPGVYWYFMDGNMNKESMTKDLESMKKAGIGNVIFLEVNVGIPVGPVGFLSEEWQDLFTHAVREGERLGIEITLGTGPGWAGSGGPWVPASQSMQHLVSASITVSADDKGKIVLPLPLPKRPFFGEGVYTPELKKQAMDFYRDIAVLAYPALSTDKKIPDIDEKALYYRAPYSSQAGVKQFLPAPPSLYDIPKDEIIDKNRIIDLTAKMLPDGTLNWTPPAGKWTIMRFVSRNNGAVTRPAPTTGLGFEVDKFDTAALNKHLDTYVGKLLKRIGKRDLKSAGGLKRLHIDSWEMGAQNWTGHFRQEFIKRRGYDPLPFYPVYAGYIVESPEISERFLWDLRQTSQELVIEYHAGQVKKYAHRNGMKLSIEPYDMNPAADLELGSVADMVMCEFWSKGYGFKTTFSCIEATSVAHINGQAIVPAESFTAEEEKWLQHPTSMKNQGDWAFATGINRLVFHTFANQALPDSLRPGMTMGEIGVNWNRGQTWWPMVGDYHRYISRSQYVLQQGWAVADILYLTPEGAPYVFLPPASALAGDPSMPDRRGYNFDGCAPGQLYKASVRNGSIVFPGGATYHLLVLPQFKTMTPALLKKIAQLVHDGATLVGPPPTTSPGLSGYPGSDTQLKQMVRSLWGTTESPAKVHRYGSGKVIRVGEPDKEADNLYPVYDLTAGILNKMGVKNDFEADGPVRYTHRTSANWDIYFVSNTTDKHLTTKAKFRSVKGSPALWDAITGKIRTVPDFSVSGSQTFIPLQFEPYQSFFLVFEKGKHTPALARPNFTCDTSLTTLSGPWQVSFDPKWGGPENISFNELTDWTLRPEAGIKYYSGVAIYRRDFDLPANTSRSAQLLLDLGKVKNMARVKLNGKDLGVVWTAPWRVNITGIALRKDNHLEIEVVNLWPNRLIGDASLPDDGVKDGKWPEWLLKGLPRPGSRYTFTTYNPYKSDSPLLESGLLGPVSVRQEK